LLCSHSANTHVDACDGDGARSTQRSKQTTSECAIELKGNGRGSGRHARSSTAHCFDTAMVSQFRWNAFVPCIGKGADLSFGSSELALHAGHQIAD
jgi:hypothetical protein